MLLFLIPNYKKYTFLSSILSLLFPITTKGKFSGSLGYPYNKNSSLQLSSDSNDFGFVISYTNTQQSAPL